MNARNSALATAIDVFSRALAAMRGEREQHQILFRRERTLSILFLRIKSSSQSHRGMGRSGHGPLSRPIPYPQGDANSGSQREEDGNARAGGRIEWKQ